MIQANTPNFTLQNHGKTTYDETEMPTCPRIKSLKPNEIEPLEIFSDNTLLKKREASSCQNLDMGGMEIESYGEDEPQINCERTRLQKQRSFRQPTFYQYMDQQSQSQQMNANVNSQSSIFSFLKGRKC